MVCVIGYTYIDTKSDPNDALNIPPDTFHVVQVLLAKSLFQKHLFTLYLLVEQVECKRNDGGVPGIRISNQYSEID